MTLVNRSGLKPLGYSVLCIPYEPEFQATRLIIPPSAQERSRMVETRAIVLEIGPECWNDESVPRAKVGDKVMIGALAGKIVNGTLPEGPNKEYRKYRMVNCGDIYCQITEEA